MDSAEQAQLQQVLLGRRDIITDRWQRAIAHTSFTTFTASEVRRKLYPLTDQAITLLLTESFDRSRAEALGASLASMHYLQPEALGRTQEVLAQELVEGLPDDRAIQLQPRLAALIGGLAAGFLRQARAMILTDQEQIRSALVSELHRAEAELRTRRVDLEQHVKQQTARLRKVNEQLRQSINEHRRTEEALRASEERFRLLAEHAQDLIYRYRLAPSRGFEYVSPAAVTLTGYTPEEYYADPDLGRKLIHPDDLPLAEALMRSPDSATASLVLRWKRKDGSVLWTEQRNVPIRDVDGTWLAIEGVARDITERRSAEEEVRAGRERLKALSRQLLEAQEAERRHIARELHDEVGQALTILKMNLQALQRSPGTPASAQLQEESIGLVERALQQVRTLSLDLRPSMLDDLGLVAALRWYTDRQAQRGGLAVEFDADPLDSRLPAQLETACFRVAQEALVNVLRHAQAGRVKVELRLRDSELHLLVGDDGVGFDVRAAQERAARGASLGLLGMQERAQLAGGRIDIASAPAAGTHIRAVFPLPPVAAPMESRPKRKLR